MTHSVYNLNILDWLSDHPPQQNSALFLRLRYGLILLIFFPCCTVGSEQLRDRPALDRGRICSAPAASTPDPDFDGRWIVVSVGWAV